MIECRVAKPAPWCRGCGSQALSRGTDTRLLVHEPFGHRSTTLVFRARRYKCAGCGRCWRNDLTVAAPARAKLSGRGMQGTLKEIMPDRLSIARVAEGFVGVSWHHSERRSPRARQAVDHRRPCRVRSGQGCRLRYFPLALGSERAVPLVRRPCEVLKHVRHGSLSTSPPIREQTGPSRLLEMVEGRSKHEFRTWLAARPQAWRDGVEVIAFARPCRVQDRYHGGAARRGDGDGSLFTS